MTMGRTTPTLRELLAGGDRRSIARSNQARALIEAAPGRIAELARLTGDADWLVAMRALDLLEKFAHTRADWVQPHRRVLIGSLADSDRWEVRLQVVRALTLLRWTARERARVAAILKRDVDHSRTFVRAWALDSLATLARQDVRLLPIVERGLAAFEQSGSKALAARAKHIRARIGRELARRRR